MNQESSHAHVPSLASRLLGAVLIKTFVEIIIVCVIVTIAAFSHFSPLLRGAIDVVDAEQIAGWAYDPGGNEATEVQLFIDGRFAASRVADEAREDLVQAGAAADARHGFRFTLRELSLTPGQHSAQVYAVRGPARGNKTLRPLAKTPRIFHIPR